MRHKTYLPQPFFTHPKFYAYTNNNRFVYGFVYAILH